jgi:hypothetical protein
MWVGERCKLADIDNPLDLPCRSPRRWLRSQPFAANKPPHPTGPPPPPQPEGAAWQSPHNVGDGGAFLLPCKVRPRRVAARPSRDAE